MSWIWTAGLALIMLAIGLAAGIWLRTGDPAAPPNFTRLTFRRGAVFTARFAPDSQTVIYGAAWEGRPVELFTTQIGSPGSRSLDLGEADVLSVSPSGELAFSIGRRWVRGFETSETLARVSLRGDAPRVLLENVHEADWGPDGESLAVARLAECRYRLGYPVGEVLFETEGWIGEMRVSPDGESIAFVHHPVRGDNMGTLMIVDLEGVSRPRRPRVIGVWHGLRKGTRSGWRLVESSGLCRQMGGRHGWSGREPLESGCWTSRRMATSWWRRC